MIHSIADRSNSSSSRFLGGRLNARFIILFLFNATNFSVCKKKEEKKEKMCEETDFSFRIKEKRRKSERWKKKTRCSGESDTEITVTRTVEAFVWTQERTLRNHGQGLIGVVLLHSFERALKVNEFDTLEPGIEKIIMTELTFGALHENVFGALNVRKTFA